MKTYWFLILFELLDLIFISSCCFFPRRWRGWFREQTAAAPQRRSVRSCWTARACSPASCPTSLRMPTGGASSGPPSPAERGYDWHKACYRKSWYSVHLLLLRQHEARMLVSSLMMSQWSCWRTFQCIEEAGLVVRAETLRLFWYYNN